MAAPPREVPYQAPSPPPPRYEPPPAYAPTAPGPQVPSAATPVGGAKLADAAAPRTPSPATRLAAADPRAPVASVAPAPSHGPAAPKQGAVAGPVVAAGSGQTLLPEPPVYTVAPGDTLGWVAHHYHVSAREVAVANGLTPGAPLRVGTRLTIPVRTPTVAQALHPSPPGHVAAADPPIVANVHVATPVEPPPAAAVNSAPAFRWPARGRIVNNYGARVNGSINDGIDLAVPEGTPVRSADDGVVAYAGNELKGYGNLVLVRHADGFVTAYANGSELLVKRNDQVHKGQVIMKSGQTGNAAAPQLHFEVRKNSAPVDPTQYLPADKSASAPL
jgi:murein DD-endopeptidase MepM/ murein hydrolase activator NlpD